ncbi:MAG: hypothetical protein ABW068_13030 [Candidatus Thiodiazotropha sp.]
MPSTAVTGIAGGPGKWLQGLVAYWEQERRSYVVTITPEMDGALYER